jgi:hypothetical protein
MLTITHTHAAGTILEGTERGDGTGQIAKAHRLRWSRHLGAWYIPRSRDRWASHRRIDALAAALRTAGHEVTVTIDNTARATEQVEADATHRAAARADALAAKADRKAADAAAAWERHEAAVAQVPPGGEPVKIGHHSEHRHRRAISKAWDTLGRSVAASEEADEAGRRAETAAHATGARHNPVTVANRIRALSADLRRFERQIVADVYDRGAGGFRPATEDERARRARRLDPLIAQKRDQIAYWTAVRDQQIADGTATNYGPGTVRKGDFVKIRDTWRRVVRANQKSVTVETDYSWTDRAPWAEVQDHRPGAPDQPDFN